MDSKMEVDKEDTEEGFQNQNPNLNLNQNKGSKGKSCKGCLYYSLLQRSKSKNLTCIGFSRTLHHVNFSIFFFFFIDGYDACGYVWLLRKSRNGKKFLGFLFCAVFAHSVQNLMGFSFWIGRLGCCYFLVNQKVKSCLLLMVLISFSCSLMMI